MWVNSFLEHLKDSATSPYAFVAYLAVIGAWLYATVDRFRLKTIASKLKDLPEDRRVELLLREYSTFPRTGLTADQWIRARIHKFILTAFLATLLASVAIILVALSKAGRDMPVLSTPTPTPIPQSQTLPSPSARLVPPGNKPQPNSTQLPAENQIISVSDMSDVRWVRVIVADTFATSIGEVKAEISSGKNGKPLKSTTSTLGGDFFLNLPVGTYQVTLTHPDYHEITVPLYVTKQKEEGPQTTQLTLQRKTGEDNSQKVIEGTVVDYSTNNGIPDVTIIIEEEQTKKTYKKTSGDHGEFRFPFLPGLYKLTFSHDLYQESSTRCEVPNKCFFVAADQIRLRKKIK